MRILLDKDYKLLSNAPNPLVEGIDFSKIGAVDSYDSPIQPSSLDLHIDKIFLPFKSEKDVPLQRASQVKECELKVGEAIRVTTKEKLNLTTSHFGFVFPPARLTRKGILVPDAGHIDPEFVGELRFTLINLSKKSLIVKANDCVASLLLFKIDDCVDAGFNTRSEPKTPTPYKEGMSELNFLPHDFLNIQKRAQTCAEKSSKDLIDKYEKERDRKTWIQIILGIAIATIIAWGSLYFSMYFGLYQRLVATEEKIENFEKISIIQSELKKAQTDIDKLKVKNGSVSPPKK